MTDQELTSLAKDRGLDKHQASESAECYGMGPLLREYGYYPKRWPLYVGTDHGPSQRDVPTKLELESSDPVFLFHSLRLANKWKQMKATLCGNILAPFVFYRKKYNIIKSSDAKGTICFPCHSTDLISVNQDLDVYIKELSLLPAEFHPIDICLYYKDIQRGIHKVFMDRGFKVYTAGHIYDEKFVERFYNIIKNYKFGTSNHLGSYVFYCVELGIPFSIYGSAPAMNNEGDPNSPKGVYHPTKEFKQMDKCTRLFSGVNYEITDKQKELVSEELSTENSLARLTVAGLFYGAIIIKVFRKVKKIWRYIKSYKFSKKYFE